MTTRAANALVALVATVLALIAAELVVAIVRPQPVYRALLSNTPAYHQEGDVLPHVLKPGFRGRHIRDEFSTRISVNTRGFRGPELRADGEPRLVFIGDSFTFGHGVEDGEAYPALLGTRLKGIEIVNGGFSAGSSPDMYLAWLRAHGDELFASAIVIGFFIGNDIDGHDSMVWTAVDREGLPTKIENAESVVVDNYLRPRVVPVGYRYPVLRESHLFHLAGSVLRRVEESIRPPRAPKPSVSDRETSPETREAIRVTKRLFDAISAWALERGIWFGVVMIPTMEQVAGIVGNGPQEAFREHFAARGIPFVDLLPEMKRDPGSLYFAEDKHWNRDGHRVAADIVQRWLCGTPVVTCSGRE